MYLHKTVITILCLQLSLTVYVHEETPHLLYKGISTVVRLLSSLGASLRNGILQSSLLVSLQIKFPRPSLLVSLRNRITQSSLLTSLRTYISTRVSAENILTTSLQRYSYYHTYTFKTWNTFTIYSGTYACN